MRSQATGPLARPIFHFVSRFSGFSFLSIFFVVPLTSHRRTRDVIKMARAFKAYGTPPPLDLDEYKDSFELWEDQWETFLALSQIDSLPAADRPVYKKNFLKSCLSKDTLLAVRSMGLTAAQLASHTDIIDALRDCCNTGRNRHVWRQQLSARKQREGESADGWLFSLRELARKCEFGADCCPRCEPTHILHQIVSGAYDETVRKDLLKLGNGITLGDATVLLRTAEAATLQSANLQSGEAKGVQGISKSAYKRHKDTLPGTTPPPDSGRPPDSRSTQQGRPPDTRPAQHSSPGRGCWWCGNPKRHPKSDCPAAEQECRNCGKPGHFQNVCQSARRPEKKPGMNGVYLHRSPLAHVAAISPSDLVAMFFSPLGSSASPVSLPILPDTGAEIDAIPAAVFRQHFPGVSLSAGGKHAVTATGANIVSLGSFAATVRWPTDICLDSPVSTVLHVLCGLRQPVLSKRSQLALGMLHRGYPHRPFPVAGPTSRPSVQQPPPSCDAVASLTPVHLTQPHAADFTSLLQEFPSIFDGVCRPMTGPACHFKLLPGAAPFAIRGSRPVAVPLLPLLRDELNNLESQNIIRKVSEPTEWVHPIVLVAKKDGGIRLCVDFRHLNKNIVRPLFDAATPFQAVRTIPAGMKFFTVIDALKGYHQVPLDEESTALTTFSTPFGRYQYLRLPFGVSHAGDDYGRRVSEVFDDLPNCRRVMEDVVVFSETYDAHLQLVRRLFQRASDHHVALNTSKLVFAQPSVHFGGYVVDCHGFRPNPELTKAISDFPTPANLTDLRSFFGLCQQVGNFSTRLADTLLPLSPLLKKNLLWEWTSCHNAAFLAARSILSTIPDLSFYDPGFPTALHVDASRLQGIGFVLRQRAPDGVWKIVQAGSRFLSDAESRYAMIELECLGASWAMDQCWQFLVGLPTFSLITDHKPLVPILNDHSLDKLDNTRILRLRLKMQRFSFTASWVPGKLNAAADALSRAPVAQPTQADELAEGPPSFAARLALLFAIRGSEPDVVDPVLENIKTAALADPLMIELREAILHGLPNAKCNLSPTLRPFWPVHDRLSIDDTDGMVMVGARVVIPESCRRTILRDLISMHQGSTKLRQRARLSVYWPGMDNDIENASRSCGSCAELLPSHPPEPLQPRLPAARPFEQIHADLATIRGRDFLILVDQFSGWPDVVPYLNKNTTARRVIDSSRAFFIQGGVPIKFWSDNGPQFDSAEFRSFLTDWGITSGTSSPHYPQSNGRAEVAVKSMKKLVAGSWVSGSFNIDNFSKSILLFRNAPLCGGASPAQLLFGHPVRDCLPAHRRVFAPEWQKDAALLERRAARSRQLRISLFNRSAHPLPPFAVGSHVVIQHPVTNRWTTPGIVVEIGPHRDYLVKTPAGRLFRRNRRFLRQRIPVMPGSVGGGHPIPPVILAPPAPQIAPGPPVPPPVPAPPVPQIVPPVIPLPPLPAVADRRRPERIKKPICRYPGQEPGSSA